MSRLDPSAVFVDVILPLPVVQTYTYQVPEEISPKVKKGVRVVVPFGNKKLYGAIVYKVHDQEPKNYIAKSIISLLDSKSIVNSRQFKLWEWISSYYMASIGEVMNAALPAGLKLSSESSLLLNPSFNGDYSKLNDKEYLIAESLLTQKELSANQIQSILELKTVYPIMQSLLEKKVALIKETLKERYKPKLKSYITINKEFQSKKNIDKAFDLLSRAPSQLNLLMTFIELVDTKGEMEKGDLQKEAKVSGGLINSIEAKSIFKVEKREVSRLIAVDNQKKGPKKLSAIQQKTLDTITTSFLKKKVALLHGITSSGKTLIYAEMIKRIIKEGKQVLYLLPEIALTTQVISRLREIFGDKITVYHSKFSDNERVEIWGKVLRKEYLIILGARSAIFLPFVRLGLVIIDEEQDSSYKQFDPSPRYHGRDSAIFLASIHKAKTLLGTATPSMESYYNTLTGKYGIAELTKRYGDIQLPEIVVEDVKRARKKKQLHSHFTQNLLDRIETTLAAKKQVILFQNRRGFAPFMMCDDCHWIPKCVHCDVSLSYHKNNHILKCHYCGYITQPINTCENCNSNKMQVQGFGTEKVEDELQLLFPGVIISRMDVDSARTKTALNKIISDLENGYVDVLVGTQMVTKGLDFEHVNLVGVLSADQLLNYPDFRANERAFQLMEQVSGRAGRKGKKGIVVIQTLHPEDNIIGYVLNHDYKGFYKNEAIQRKNFGYPPYSRLIKITLKHKKEYLVEKASVAFVKKLRELSVKTILGPAPPPVPRIRGYYLRDILIKLVKDSEEIRTSKEKIYETIDHLSKDSEIRSAIIQLDVDPM